MDEEKFLHDIRSEIPTLKISKDLLSKPSFDFVVTAYKEIMSYCRIDIERCGLTEEQMTYLRNHHGEVLGHHCSTYNMYLILKNLFKKLGYNEFAYTDLIRPSPKRNYMFLSGLFNFGLYMVKTEDEFAEEYDRLKSLKDHIETLIERNHNTKTALQNKIESGEKYEEVMGERKKQLKRISEEIERKNSVLQETYASSHDIKQQCLKDELKVKSQEEELRNLEDEICNVQGQMVQSPQQVRDSLNNLKKTKEELQQTEKERAGLIKNLRGEIEQLVDIIQLQDGLKALVEKFRTSCGDEKSKEKSVLYTKYEELQEQLKNVEINIKQKKDQIQELCSKTYGAALKKEEIQKQIKAYIKDSLEDEQQLKKKLSAQEKEIIECKENIHDEKINIMKKEKVIKDLEKQTMEEYKRYCRLLDEHFRVATDSVLSLQA